MDRNSNRYRKCSNCGYEFMTDHLLRIFCCDQCADEFHNYKKREARAEDLLSGPGMTEGAISQANTLSLDLSKNINTLDHTSVDPDEGTVYHVEELGKLGLNLLAYSGRGPLFNIDPNYSCHFIQMGCYRLYRVDYSRILIVKEKIK